MGAGSVAAVAAAYKALDDRFDALYAQATTDAERERIETEFCENPPEPDYGDDY